MGAVNHQLKMQIIIAQQDGRWSIWGATIADPLFRPSQTNIALRCLSHQPIRHNAIRRHIRMLPGCKRDDVIQKRPGTTNNLSTPDRIIIAHRRQIAVRRDNIGSVKRIIETAPTRICGIDGKPRILHRNHQLWPSNITDLRIDALGFDRKIGPLWQ